MIKKGLPLFFISKKQITIKYIIYRNLKGGNFLVTENLLTLKIHKLTEEQYQRELAAGRIDENALYLTPYEETDLSEYATQEYVDERLATKQPVGDYALKSEIPSVGDLESYVDNKITSKQDVITGTAGQFVVIGEDGKPTTKTIPYAEEATF